MPYVADSRFAGYLGPQNAPLQDGGFDDFIHDLIAGITNLPPDLVRPRWQTEPVNMPDYDNDWCAFGSNRKTADWEAVVQHIDDGEDGYDELQRTEEYEYLLTFYGPNCDLLSSIWRDGVAIDQNRAILRANGTALVEVQGWNLSPELVNQRWVPRADATTVFRRRVVRRYNVLHLLQAQGDLTADTYGEDGPEGSFDTINQE